MENLVPYIQGAVIAVAFITVFWLVFSPLDEAPEIGEDEPCDRKLADELNKAYDRRHNARNKIRDDMSNNF